MPIDLAELLAPEHTAVLTMEMQRGIVGDLSVLPQLADAVAAAGTAEATGRLLTAARAAGARVVHCTFEVRADRAGTTRNAPLLAASGKGEPHMVAGTPSAEVLAPLGPEPTDLFAPRCHGVSPFIGTSLDATLRALGVSTVVATGVSLNVGVLGLVIEAVNFGYRVALPTDAVTGLPASYGDAVIANTLSLLATRITVDDAIAAWS